LGRGAAAPWLQCEMGAAAAPCYPPPLGFCEVGCVELGEWERGIGWSSRVGLGPAVCGPKQRDSGVEARGRMRRAKEGRLCRTILIVEGSAACVSPSGSSISSSKGSRCSSSSRRPPFFLFLAGGGLPHQIYQGRPLIRQIRHGRRPIRQIRHDRHRWGRTRVGPQGGSEKVSGKISPVVGERGGARR
jgi:hypothetical protein